MIKGKQIKDNSISVGKLDLANYNTDLSADKSLVNVKSMYTVLDSYKKVIKSGYNRLRRDFSASTGDEIGNTFIIDNINSTPFFVLGNIRVYVTSNLVNVDDVMWYIKEKTADSVTIYYKVKTAVLPQQDYSIDIYFDYIII